MERPSLREYFDPDVRRASEEAALICFSHHFHYILSFVTLIGAEDAGDWPETANLNLKVASVVGMVAKVRHIFYASVARSDHAQKRLCCMFADVKSKTRLHIAD
jgi:hypothetical protein